MNRLTSPRRTLLSTACLAALASTAAPPIRRNNLFTEDGARNLAKRNDLPDAGGGGTLSPAMPNFKQIGAGTNCIDRHDLPVGAPMVAVIGV